MDDKVHVVEQHPLRLFVAFFVGHAQPDLFQALVDRVGNRLDLPRIGPAAHHKVIGECPGILFQFEDGDLFGLFILTGEDGFIYLLLQVILYLHTGSLIVTCLRLERIRRCCILLA